MAKNNSKKKNRQAKIARKMKKRNRKFNGLIQKTRKMFDDQGSSGDQLNFIDPPDGIKMSEVILKIAEPLIKQCHDDDDRIKTAISLTILTWNNLLLPEEKQNKNMEALIDRAFSSNPAGEDVAVLEQVSNLIAERKNIYFPDVRKLIVNYDLKVSKNGDITLNISSVPVDPTAVPESI